MGMPAVGDRSLGQCGRLQWSPDAPASSPPSLTLCGGETRNRALSLTDAKKNARTRQRSCRINSLGKMGQICQAGRGQAHSRPQRVRSATIERAEK